MLGWLGAVAPAKWRRRPSYDKKEWDVGAAGTFIHTVTRWPFIRQVLLYGAFGVVAAGCDFLAFRALREAGLALLAANLISVNLGIAVSFVCNAFLNFRRTDVLGRRAVVFFCVGWSGLALSSLILWIGVERMELDETWVKIASIVVVAAYQFTLNKLVTFRARWLERGRPGANLPDAVGADPATVPAAQPATPPDGGAAKTGASDG
jgi:putative flippase GtrA